MRCVIFTAFCALLVACDSGPDTAIADPAFIGRENLPVQASDDYYSQAHTAVAQNLPQDFEAKAKNVIIFIGDGMGVSTVTAARIYAGQLKGRDGESNKLSMETLPYLALSRTYSHDFQVPDSAATATAMLSGVKTRSRVVGLRSGAAPGNCASQAGQETESLFVLAERAGLATGIVSTARITHATPAAAYAKTAHRDWEDDTAFGFAPDSDCKDVARQLVEWPVGDGFEVALGGGRRHFMTTDMIDPEQPDLRGKRQDGRNLIAAWEGKSDTHETVLDEAAFKAVNFDSEARVLGLFEPSHMQFDYDRPADIGGEPSLAEMTKAAITRLSRDEDGFVLLVEGGRIDHAHHGVNAARALGDTVAFDQAVATALEMTDASETLIIVTADHSHTMTMAGYPRRGNPILGKVETQPGQLLRAADGKPYTTLSYANGPTACTLNEDGEADCTRRDLSQVDTDAPDFRQDARVPAASETHSGEDVAIFAGGPGAELVRGVMDQQEIFLVMGYASGLVAE